MLAKLLLIGGGKRKKKSIPAMFKILSEGRRAKNTPRGISVGMDLSPGKVASQIKMMLLLPLRRRRLQFHIFPDGKKRRVSTGQKLWSLCKSAGAAYLHSEESRAGSLISRGKSTEEEKAPPAPPPPRTPTRSPQMPPCLALLSLPSGCFDEN